MRNNGSPPRAWGRRNLKLTTPHRHRFTPTCVGTTFLRMLGMTKEGVHPHVRGDDVMRSITYATAAGSPPRAWGRRRIWRWGGAFTRFTPTCVGTTVQSSPSFRPRTVHPHVRGDDAVEIRGLVPDSGSPPRAWGRRDSEDVLPIHARFTPTCVGTTLEVRQHQGHNI